ncbi:hypothetical protein [Labrys wisconsinensis]|uniref:Uncharacterized protein n=1 Tax=Labrys wisconsinensis TaxID=425677 RepID=A0ABU0J7G8_9HYPH|nr:hypothetical protein [Labrys wisconsinensis]MDQ0470211.1 hypothetical protein [Labrys wisconsinensis]
MSWLEIVWAELAGLFVDDGWLALMTVVWLLACALLLPHFSLPSAIRPAILFAGLIVILARSAVRRAGER